ncbi:MAG: hypothetical protein M0Z36_02665 [Thermaerobacter sp.]|nr:hypothetical protein [Thermaerobacter sp.]
MLHLLYFLSNAGVQDTATGVVGLAVAAAIVAALLRTAHQTMAQRLGRSARVIALLGLSVIALSPFALSLH